MSAPKQTIIGGHISIAQVLGSGGFGKVYYGFNTKEQIPVAVKVIDKELVKRNGIEQYVEREIDVMRRVKNKHVVRLYEAIETSKAYHLIMELAANGELFDRIVGSQRFDEKTSRGYFQQLIDAVHYCHNKNIVHRDLKAENLLLGENDVLKVCDFGLSRYTREGRFNDTEVLFTSLAGSIDYQAPEVLKECGYEGSACDMWSCGCILFFMLCGYLPFTDRTDGLTRKRILSCQYNRKNRYLSEGAADLISHLLVTNPAERYTTTDVIHHPWFRVDLPQELFPDEAVASPQSTSTSGEFIKRVITPQDGSGTGSPISSPTSQKAEEIRRAFSTCNITGDGFLNRAEVRDALIKLNGEKKISEKELDDFMHNFTLDENGCITEEKFVIGWTMHQNELGKKYNISRMANLFHYNVTKEFLKELRSTFDSIDTETTGVITKQKLMDLSGLSASDVQKLFDATSPDQKGRDSINFEHFVLLCTQYEIMNNHPLATRLRHLESIFDVTEYTIFKNYLNTGFTVAGTRQIIKAHLMTHQDVLHTKFEEGDVKGFLYGTIFKEDRRNLEVGVRLLSAAPGYSKVIAYRIGGKTTDFHEWFRELRKVMKEEVLQCEEDITIKGQGELM